MALLREAHPQDAAAIAELLESAFGRGTEARLVERLHAADRVRLSLVAEAAEHMLGVVVFSQIAVGAEQPALALAPLAVRPAYHRLGIASALVSAGLQRLREAGHSRVLVLGDPAYYSRFGFVPAGEYAIACPFPAPAEAFMALELHAGAFAGCAGTAHYGHEFDDSD